jgi:hypothetical protein
VQYRRRLSPSNNKRVLSIPQHWAGIGLVAMIRALEQKER